MLRFLKRSIRIVAIGVVFVAVVVAIIGFFWSSITPDHALPTTDPMVVRQQYARALEQQTREHGNDGQKLALQFYTTMSCSIIGEGCKDQVAGFNSSLMGKLTNLSVYTYTHPPASGIAETYHAFSNVGFVPKLYAAEGIGFAAIKGFRPIWIVFRNISYSVLVVVMVIIAFAIMFRMKIGSQAEIAIQNALPRIFISLLLITFSYAIAGFLIDMMYVVLGLAVTLLCNANTYCDASERLNNYLTAGPQAIMGGFIPYKPTYMPDADNIFIYYLRKVTDHQVVGFFRTLGNLSDSLMSLMPGVIQVMIKVIGGAAYFVFLSYIMSFFAGTHVLEFANNIQFLAASLGNLPSALFGGFTFLFLVAIMPFIIVPVIVSFFIMLTMVMLFFRIYFMLLFTYLRILLYILFAPLYMLLEALPGRNSFSGWFRNMVGELLTFPLLAIFFMVGALIVNNFQYVSQVSVLERELQPVVENIPVINYEVPNVWQPPFLGGTFLGAVNTGYTAEQEAFLMVAGMGILFLIPDLVKMVKEALGVKGSPVNFGLGTFLAGGTAAFAGATGLLGKGLGLSNLLYGAGSDKGLRGALERQMAFLREPLRARSLEDAPQSEVPGGGLPHETRQKVQQRVRDRVMASREVRDETGNVIWRQGERLPKGLSPWKLRSLREAQIKRETETELTNFGRVSREVQEKQERRETQSQEAEESIRARQQEPPPAQTQTEGIASTPEQEVSDTTHIGGTPTEEVRPPEEQTPPDSGDGQETRDEEDQDGGAGNPPPAPQNP